MRKVFGILTTIIMMVCTAPIMAETVDLWIDGHKVQSSLEAKENEYPDIEVPAQVVNGVTLVPLRFISESMCAEVHYENPTIIITYEGDVFKLTVGEKSVTKNGEAMDDLLGAPVVKDGVTLVPLRFIAEAFGAKVQYANGKVTVDSPAVMYNGTKISSLQCNVKMIMGGYIEEAQSNKTIERTIEAFNLSAENKIEEPKAYTNFMGDAMDTECCYLTLSYYAAFDANENELFNYEVYQLLNNYEGIDMPGWLIHDVKADEWYKYKRPNNDMGYWKQIYNDVA